MAIRRSSLKESHAVPLILAVFFIWVASFISWGSVYLHWVKPSVIFGSVPESMLAPVPVGVPVDLYVWSGSTKLSLFGLNPSLPSWLMILIPTVVVLLMFLKIFQVFPVKRWLLWLMMSIASIQLIMTILVLASNAASIGIGPFIALVVYGYLVYLLYSDRKKELLTVAPTQNNAG